MELKIEMIENTNCIIKFKHGDFKFLKDTLLKDLQKESFAILIGKHEYINDIDIVNVFEIVFTPSYYYNIQNHAFLDIRKDFIHEILLRVTQRFDVDTIIDVHTHPFCDYAVSFSGTDNNDETTFFRFISNHFNLKYASIVLSLNSYDARIWCNKKNGDIEHRKAKIKTQTSIELGESTKNNNRNVDDYHKKKFSELFDRSVLTLGLDVMREIVSNQIISIVGVGGLGSIIAEHLAHMGFQHLCLFDDDHLELSNLNRFVGGYYEQALNKCKKVSVVKEHLQKINPDILVDAFDINVTTSNFENLIVDSDWIFIATDNHTSRFVIQKFAFKYFIPFISSGVNITVVNNKIQDCSGEVITIRMGDCFCLNCLGRINFTNMAYESHPDSSIKKKIIDNGYVRGMEIKEPAVKTLNTMLATMAVNALIKQYTASRQPPIIVYENNKYECIYEDKISLEDRNKHCSVCCF